MTTPIGPFLGRWPRRARHWIRLPRRAPVSAPGWFRRAIRWRSTCGLDATWAVSDVDPIQLAPSPTDRKTMPKITYVHPNGAQEVLDVPVGTSVMRAAILNGIDGIVAECGGEMMCATCHVYVEEDQLGRTPAQSDDEKAMLEFTASERRPNSRLSCQLLVTPELDGLIVYLPETQV